MDRQTRVQKRLCLEPLESRRLLAGDVTVALDNGDLCIEGDSLGNSFVSFYEEGVYLITGLDGTTINGRPSIVIRGEDVTGNLEVNMDDGDDIVKILQGVPDGDLSISMGEGADEVHIGDPVITGRTVVKTGPGDDLVWAEGVAFADLYIKTTGGDDVVQFDYSGAINAKIGTGAGDDVVVIRDGFGGLVEQLDIATGVGADMVSITNPGDDEERITFGGDLTVSTSLGDDTVLIEDMEFLGALYVNVGFDQDSLTLRNVEARNQEVLLCGSRGDDRTRVIDSYFGELRIETSDGMDNVEIENTTIDTRLTVQLGHGDDKLTLEESTSSTETLLNGSAGDDTLERLSGNLLAGLVKRSFETEVV